VIAFIEINHRLTLTVKFAIVGDPTEIILFALNWKSSDLNHKGSYSSTHLGLLSIVVSLFCETESVHALNCDIMYFCFSNFKKGHTE
jgi:hypothetical protein